MKRQVKLGFVLSTILALSACTEDERPKVNGIHVLQKHYVGIVCFDDVKYILYNGGIAVKISNKTKQPELCTE